MNVCQPWNPKNSRVIAIDPGVEQSALALFEDNLLKESFYFPTRKLTAYTLVGMAIELPQVYAGAKAQGTPESLLQLARAVGFLEHQAESQGAEVKVYRPSEWKGQLPKDVHHNRLGDYLRLFGTAEEKKVWKGISKKKGDHDLRDAVGLGLFHLGRTLRGGELK